MQSRASCVFAKKKIFFSRRHWYNIQGTESTGIINSSVCPSTTLLVVSRSNALKQPKFCLSSVSWSWEENKAWDFFHWVGVSWQNRGVVDRRLLQILVCQKKKGKSFTNFFVWTFNHERVKHTRGAEIFCSSSCSLWRWSEHEEILIKSNILLETKNCIRGINFLKKQDYPVIEASEFLNIDAWK